MKRLRSIALLPALIGGLFLLASSAAQAQPAGWGTVKGKILYKGKVPPKQKANVDKDQKHCLSKGQIFLEDWVVDPKTKGVRDVFVWLMPLNKGEKMPIHPKLKALRRKEVSIDQPCCMFVPHALAMREGQKLVIKNSSPIPHNFRYQGHPFTNGGGNFAIPPGGKHIIKKDFVADYKLPVLINCDIHKWMSATVRVFDHPYYAVTGEDGTFTIRNAPAGKYRLIIWKRGLGYYGGAKGREGRIISIPANGTANAGTFEITKPKGGN